MGCGSDSEISVIKNDCFFGKTFIELTSKAWDHFVVLAWLPSEKGRKMILVPGDCSDGELVKEGDVIIGYVKKLIKNYNTESYFKDLDNN